MRWHSARLRLVCLIENVGGVRLMDSICVFRARDFKEAKARAIEIGRAAEEEYLNSEGQRVRWLLKEVVSLDQIAAESLDGAEVYSEPVELTAGELYNFDAGFRPEDSDPTQTI